MDFNDLSCLFTIHSGKGAFQRVCQTKDAGRILSFLRTMNTLITGAFLLFVALSIFIAVSIATSTAARPSAIMPETAGMPPVERLVDETGYVTGDQLDYVLRKMESLAEETNVQMAMYCTFSSPGDIDALYRETFADGKGLLIVIEEHEDSGQIFFKAGSGLADVFTEKVMSEMQNRVSGEMSYFTHNRAERVMEKLWIFLPSLFDDDSFSNTMNYLTAVFWLVVGPLFGWGTARMCCNIVGIPGKRSTRKELIEQLKAMQNQ